MKIIDAEEEIPENHPSKHKFKLNMYIWKLRSEEFIHMGIRPNALTQISYILYLLTVKISEEAQRSWKINIYDTQNAVKKILPKKLGEEAIRNAKRCVSYKDFV